jgi:hypothetical protein
VANEKTNLSELAPITTYIEGIADRGSTYALIALGALAGAMALLDQFTGGHTLSTTEFIVVLGVGGSLMLAGALLQFLTENAVRTSVAEGQRTAGQEAAAASERYLKYLQIAREAGETDFEATADRYVAAMDAVKQTNPYAARVEKARAESR